MGEATRAIGKLIISIIAATILATMIYSSFNTFGLGGYLNFQYSAEICAGSLGLISFILIYALMMSLKHHL